MIRSFLTLLLLACALVPACTTIGPGTAIEAAPRHPDPPILSEQLLLETLQYAFLWHDDLSFDLTDQTGRNLDIFCRVVPRELDEGDKSQFAELWIPEIGMVIELKRSDYRIEELNLHVLDDQFKVRRVVRENAPPAPLSAYWRQPIVKSRAREWFAEHIRRASPLPHTLAARLKATLTQSASLQEQQGPTPQVFYVAPISPVSDELWVLHETTRQLLRFTSDMDLDDEAYWKTTPIHLKVYELHPDIVQSPADLAAGTLKLRKDFVGRALFNCIVLGQRIEIPEGSVEPEEADR